MDSEDKPATSTIEEAMSLEAFITSNWQILTIFGVFAGITNYMSGLGSIWLGTLGFLLTFIVEVEILMLLLRIKNRSFLLNAFTLLSVAFIAIFAGFIYSNHLSNILTGFGVALYPLIEANRVFLLRLIFFVSTMTVILGLYRHLRSVVAAALKFLGKDKVIMAGFLSTLLVLTAGIFLLAFFSLTPEGEGPAEYTATTLAAASESTTTTSSTSTSTSTTTTLPSVACFVNSDCGNKTETKICHRGDVYIQKSTPLCQRPGTPEARCVYKTGLEGESITTEANPHERCSRGCVDGECVTNK